MNPLRLLRSGIDLCRRRSRARALGVRYVRSIDWDLPDRIRFGGEFRPLRYPPGPGTRAAFHDVLICDAYRLRSLPGPIETVVDVGGYAGFFGIRARLLYPRAVVRCYEPNPAVYPDLAANAAWAGYHPFPAAVGAEPGRGRVVPADDAVSTTVVPSADGDVPVVPFRQVVAELGGRVDLLKLDCEGAEWDIFTDPEPFRAVRHLTMEFHLTGDRTVADLRRVVTGLGFVIREAESGEAGYGLLRAARAGR